MAFWWVNHKQTYRQETDGGYVWSPKANANGARNVSYDNLTRCQRGDVVFSYANGRISQIGLVETAAVTAPKPPEFGATGDNWSQEGWLVQVNWQPLRQALDGASLRLSRANELSGRTIAGHLGKPVESASSRSRNRRLEVRATAEDRQLIDRAVAASGTDLTGFVITHLRLAAQQVLADREEFRLDSEALEAWERINQRPARALQGLRALMDRPSPFQE